MEDPSAAVAVASDGTQERLQKRQRLSDASADSAAGAHDDAGDDGPPPPGPPPAEQLSAALAKIASHISNAKKFPKASALLRQVLDAVTKTHSDDLFAAVSAAFTHPEHATDPLLRKDYMRLIKAVSIRADGVLNRQQRAQLEVYNILAVTQNELFTDDSFVFNKVVGKIKSSIADLPEGDEEQEAAWVQLFPEEAAALGITAPAAPAQQQPRSAAAAAGGGGGGRTSAAAAEEADPFGLDDFIAKAEAEAAAAAAASAKAAETAAATSSSPPSDGAAAAATAEGEGPSKEQQQQPTDNKKRQQQQSSSSSSKSAWSSPWDAASCLVMLKQALLSCIETAKTHQHKLAWARTSIELLIEEVGKPAAQGGLAGRFVGGQKQQLQELLKFVNAERAARRSGVNRRPGGKGTGEYQTSFEKARAEWGSANWVSARGKVGGQGDGSQANWLG